MSVVCIAGMHRSGTSMVARMLNLCGLYLGKESEMIPPAPDNPEGYWENIFFTTLNDRILTSLKGGWDLPPVVKPGWENIPELAAHQAEAQLYIANMAGHPHWGWKDPRNSLILPFWRKLIPDLKVIVCLRDPYQVAQSLARRGLSSHAFSMNLWRTYYQQLLDNVPSQNRLITHYDAFLFDCKAELQRVLAFLQITVDDQRLDEACGSAHAQQKHHKAFLADTSEAGIFPEMVEFYTDLCAQSGPIFKSAMQAFSHEGYGAATHDSGEDKEATQSDLDGDKLIADLQNRLWQNAFTIRSLEESKATLMQETQALSTQVAEREGQVQALSAQVAEREGQVQALSTQVAEREGQVQAITRMRAWRVAQWLQRTRAFLLPHGSLRARIARGLLSSLRIPFTLRRSYKMRGDLALIRKYNLFDHDWYLIHNPDVAQAGVDPAQHYLFFGGFEGRDPSSTFSNNWYLATYKDVEQARINPLLHYLKFGRKEGRSALPPKEEPASFHDANQNTYTPKGASSDTPVASYLLAPAQTLSSPRVPLGEIQTVTFYSHSYMDALTYLRLLGPAKQAGLQVINGVENGQIHVERVGHGDVIVLQRDFPSDLAAYEQILELAHRQGKPVILELDDLLFELPEDHPDRQTHRYAKALLPILRALTEVDFVTVTTHPLREYVLPYNQNVAVLPNYFNDELWRLRPPSPFAVQKDTIVIGYMGGITHGPDLDLIVPALLDLDRRYPGKLLFRFWGGQPPSPLRMKPNVEWFPNNFPSYPAFAEYFQRQSADIFIAPLRDNLFNVCKSPIKYFEYSALGAPGIFSKIAPYSSAIVDEFNGMLAASLSDWTNALTKLIEDPGLRLTIARNAQENIRSNWLLSNNAARWHEAYKEAVKLVAHEKAPASALQSLVISLSHQIAEVGVDETQAAQRQQAFMEIRESRAWRIAMQLEHARLWLVPPDSLRARLVRNLFSPRQASKAAGDLELIVNSDLFDESWYLENNPDVDKSDMSSALHYLQFGGFEGRDPSPRFSSSWYLTAYKDVKQVHINPLIHYLRYGRKERRSALPPKQEQALTRNANTNTAPKQGSLARYVSSLFQVWKLEGGGGIGQRFAWGLGKVYSTWRQGGPDLVWQKVRSWLDRPVPDPYHPLLPVPSHAVSSENEQRHAMENFRSRPLISILMPVYNTPPRYLAAAIDSIRNQTYTNFEICICDDGSLDPAVAKELKRISSQDQSIRVFTFAKNNGISAATNKAAELARGDFYALMDHDDELTPDALFEVVRMLNLDPLADVVYSDQDKIDSHGLFSEPFYKPDWSPEYFRSAMYVGHLLVVKKELFHQVGGMLSRFDGVQDYEFMLRVSEIAKRIRHIPKILYHWRKIPGSIALNVDEKGDRIEELQVKAVDEQLQRLNIPAIVTINPSQRHRVIILPKPRSTFPLVSIIALPGKLPMGLERCVRSIFQRTSYPNYEVIVVANQTTDKTLLAGLNHYPVDFVELNDAFNFSKASNLGMQNAQGEFIVLLDTDTEVVTAGWIEVLLSYLQREGVEAVGPMLIYPNHTVQHAGIALGIRGAADHLMRHFPYVSDGYAGSLCCPREVSAVTGACMMLRRKDYVNLGGLVEHYVGQYQDVDLCLRISRTGKRVLYVPHAVLIHYENHGPQDAFDDHMDRALFLDIWGDTVARGDPYYNPHFSLDAGDYSFKRRGKV